MEITPDPEHQNAINCLRLTLPEMQKHNIPATPQNYAVWYEYFMKTTPELNQAIDEITSSAQEFSSKTNKTLYETFISERPVKVMESVQDATKLLVNRLMDKLSIMHQGTQQFSGVLDDCETILDGEVDTETFHKLVSTLVDESHKVQESNSAMELTLSDMESELGTLRKDIEKLNAIALIDQLTNIGNRRSFDDSMESLLNRYKSEDTENAEEHEEPIQTFTLLICDIDHFKSFNDNHGHATGDRVLSYVAKCLKRCIRGEDGVYRYGGEEFVLTLPETNLKGGLAVAENIRSYIANKKLTAKEGKKMLGRVTVSIGVAQIRASDTIEELIDRADQAMYRAKASGRNCVNAETPCTTTLQ